MEWIRESVQRQQGSPAAGAAVGAIVGGVLGRAIFGHSSGTLVGAVGGAIAGQGSAETRSYDIAVRLDDGAEQVFVFGGYTPFRVGDRVALSSAGLQPVGPQTTAPVAPPPGIPPPPPMTPPPPPYP